MRILCLVGWVGGTVLGCATPASVGGSPPVLSTPQPSDVQVMVLGTYHMAGSNADLINVEVDGVLTERRQRELRALADALSAFQPTVVFTERVTSPPDYVDPKFAEFSDETLGSNQNERAQVAYRLAKRAAVTRVHGIDEVPSDGEPDYFPFNRLMAHAAATGQQSAIEALLADAKKMVQTFTRTTRDDSIPRKLLKMHRGPMSSPEFYYKLAAFDVGEDQPGAELQAYWFMRNAKIWSKLRDVVEPGDRAVVVYGAGHKFWLEHMARQSPGFIVVDPAPYLEAADRRLKDATP